MLLSSQMRDAFEKGNPAAVAAGGDYETWREETLQIHSIFSWVDNGLPVFELTHSLMAALLLTDPSNVDAEDVNLPFPTFIVRFPQPFWSGTIDVERPPAPVHYALVHNYQAPLVEVFDGGMRTVGHEARIINRLIVKADVVAQIWERRPPMPRTGKIGDWLIEEVNPHISSDIASMPLTQNDNHLVTAFRRLLVNLSLYIAEHGRGEKSGQRRTDRHASRREPATLPGPDIWVLGREVKLDRNLVDAAKALTDSERKGGSQEGWKLMSRFTVRGHWRNQAHGPGHSLRMQKWIAPHWKGEGPTFSHVYR